MRRSETPPGGDRGRQRPEETEPFERGAIGKGKTAEAFCSLISGKACRKGKGEHDEAAIEWREHRAE